MNVVGLRFSRLVITEQWRDARVDFVRCQCDCGAVTTKRLKNVRYGFTKSCGCLRAEVTPWAINGHGQKQTREYGVWCQMKSRCHNPKVMNFPRYGGRGIHVCARWRESFMAFLDDMGRRPTERHQLDRIDNNGHYEPTNCRWALPPEQHRNRRDNYRVTYDGVTRTASEWDRHLGFPRNTVWQRLNRCGWDVAKTLTTPIRKP